MPHGTAADVFGRPHSITARVEVPDQGAQGVLLAHGGGRNGGYALYVKDNRLHYVHSYHGVEKCCIDSDVELPTGPVTLGVAITPNDNRGATATLTMDGEPIGQGSITTIMPAIAWTSEGLCCGYDSGWPVGDYPPPFRFTGTIERVVVQLE